MSLPETTPKSLISSLTRVIPEPDRISPSSTSSAFGRFVVDLLYLIGLLTDLFSLYILFSHVRQRDALMGILRTFARAGTTFERNCNITWSEMGKQTIQAKEVY